MVSLIYFYQFMRNIVHVVIVAVEVHFFCDTSIFSVTPPFREPLVAFRARTSEDFSTENEYFWLEPKRTKNMFLSVVRHAVHNGLASLISTARVRV
jgi:hypothetical protein